MTTVKCTITVEETPDGISISANGALRTFEVACLGNEIARMLSRFASPAELTDDGLLLVGEIANKFARLVEGGGVYFIGIAGPAVAQREEPTEGRKEVKS